MVKVIVRNHNLLFWRYINWSELIKYIDSLKSREYKAFIANTYNQQDTFEKILKNSPLVVLLAFKESVENLNVKLSTFEAGYLIFCLSHVIHLDVSFLYYYWKNYDIKSIKAIKILLTNINYFLTIFYLDQYIVSLKYFCSISSLKICQIGSILDTITEYQVGKRKYPLLLNLKSNANYLSILTFFKKIPILKRIISFLFSFFKLGDGVTLRSNFSTNYLFVDENKILRKVWEIFVFHISYELSIISNTYFKSIFYRSEILFLYDYNFLLFLFHEGSQLVNFKRQVINLLSTYNISLKIDNKIWPYSMLLGISTKTFFISVKSEVYPFYFFIKPSLQCQFILMKQVSWTLYRSRSVPFFLLNIRLNMLILLWSKIFLKHSVDKIFYLLDYLLDLKLRYFHKCINFDKHVNISLFKELFDNYPLSVFLKYKQCHFFTSLHSRRYYKFYFVVKLVWIYRLVYKINLREAI